MTPALDLGLPLLTAHLLGDFVLQTDRMAAGKGKPAVLLGHATIHAALGYVLAGRWTAWPLPLAIFAIHAAIDFVKARRSPGGLSPFLADQAAHLAAIVLLARWLGPAGAPGQWSLAWGPAAARVFILASGAIACVRASAFVVGFWVQPYLEEIRRASGGAAPRGLTNGGRIIGQWERGLIFLFFLLGQPGAIGFLIAAKSIFRFGELSDRQNRMEAEYITIGTLMSFGLGAALAALTLWAERSLIGIF